MHADRSRLRAWTAAAILLLSPILAFASCTGERAPEQPPQRLEATGLYADFGARRIADDVLPFSPQYPLWSDGAAKRRWIRLPAGTAIDASDPDRWRFPIGTKLWKEFSFGRAIETRYLHHVAEGRWLRATYVWTADGSDATLAPEAGIAAAAESAPGVPYDVPARSACTACHDGGTGPVLGFSSLQLSPDRDPLALHAEVPPAGAIDLPGLVARGLVVGLPQRFLAAPPRIAARSADERALLGYLHGNCSACHNDDGPLASLGLSFAWRSDDDAGAGTPPRAIASTVGRPSRFRIPHTASVRVAAGAPDESVLMHRVRSRDPLVQMPPLATRRPDQEAIERIAEWIRGADGSPVLDTPLTDKE